MSEINNQSDDSVNKQSSLELNSQAKTERGDNQTKQQEKLDTDNCSLVFYVYLN